ncbi:MAG TPA: glycine--tRNA ligase subunit beta [Kofleriaceae bacterium]|nr:glycine--tRNA ligase subunit beta [Kofleriaceae bacterium]
MPADLLFEIGCEEIPAKMLTRALAELPGLVEARLTAARLGHAGVRVLGTPRRLAVIVKQLADRQPDLKEEIVGPPASAAFAADGSLTKAGQGFAARNGVDPGSLDKREVAGKKGLYVVAVRSVVGQDARGLLPDLLIDLARSIAWPKSQRWGWGETTFVRPVQWLVALLGGDVVPLSWAGLTSGRRSRGHRFLANHAVEIAGAEAYVEALRAAHVVVDPELRRDLVRAELARLERETGLAVRPDEELLGEVIHLGEYPVGLSGAFDPAFLEVPEEIIVTAMRTHQRYFAMEHPGGKLANRFATMMATIVADPAVVQRGNEYVIASRLADAKFFFAEDRKKSFEQWNEKLASVVFQAKLGDRAKTIGHKIRRIEANTAALAERVRCDRDAAARAAHLCKADLASSVVGEFPELQGVMGKHYARLADMPDAVAVAIEEHYFPRGQGGALPSTLEGALVALADRIDTLVGCFAAGLAPSGSADPFGLRRAAIGILAILLGTETLFATASSAGSDREAPLRVDELIDLASRAYGDTLDTAPAREPLREFFRTRLRGLLVEDGLAAQDVDVVLGAGADDPCDARLRARAVAVVPAAAREVFKRIANILDDARAKRHLISGEVKPAVFVAKDGAEARLWNAFTARTERLGRALDQHQYRDSFVVLAELGPDVAAFFDRGGVMVMDPDPILRENRLSLLQRIYEPFARIADFRLLGGAA